MLFVILAVSLQMLKTSMAFYRISPAIWDHAVFAATQQKFYPPFVQCAHYALQDPGKSA